MRWRRRRIDRERADRSRDELLRFAAGRIADLIDDDPARTGVAAETMALLEQIVLDGQPTPQPTPGNGDSIEVDWLVNDWYVGLIVTGEDDEEDDAGWILWAEGPDGVELFEAHGRPGALLDWEALRWTQNLLASMGDQIRGFDMWPVWRT